MEKAKPDTKSLAAVGGGVECSVAAALQSSALNATLAPQVDIIRFHILQCHLHFY